MSTRKYKKKEELNLARYSFRNGSDIMARTVHDLINISAVFPHPFHGLGVGEHAFALTFLTPYATSAPIASTLAAPITHTMTIRCKNKMVADMERKSFVAWVDSVVSLAPEKARLLQRIEDAIPKGKYCLSDTPCPFISITEQAGHGYTYRHYECRLPGFGMPIGLEACAGEESDSCDHGNHDAILLKCSECLKFKPIAGMQSEEDKTDAHK